MVSYCSTPLSDKLTELWANTLSISHLWYYAPTQSVLIMQSKFISFQGWKLTFYEWILYVMRTGQGALELLLNELAHCLGGQQTNFAHLPGNRRILSWSVLWTNCPWTFKWLYFRCQFKTKFHSSCYWEEQNFYLITGKYVQQWGPDI